MTNVNLVDLGQAIDKAIQNTTNQPNSMGITKTPEIQSKTVKYQPFLEWLESQGRCKDVSTANVSFYEETGNNPATAIAETGDIPAYRAQTFNEVPERMRTLVVPIQISDLAQEGTDFIDLKQKFVEEGYIGVNNLTDKLLLDGNATSNPLEFDKIWKNVTSESNEGDPITKNKIKEMFDTCIDAGGRPDVIVTDSTVAGQLDDLIDPLIRYENPAEVALGHKVTTYRSPDGSYVPIIVDRNMPTDNDTHSMLLLDSTTVEVLYKTRPTYIQLAKTKLASNDAIYSHVVAHNTGAFKSGTITNIGVATGEVEGTG